MQQQSGPAASGQQNGVWASIIFSVAIIDAARASSFNRLRNVRVMTICKQVAHNKSLVPTPGSIVALRGYHRAGAAQLKH